MQTNWSVILNVLLLVGVVVSIGLLLKARRQQNKILLQEKPALNLRDEPSHNDDIIAVRKIIPEPFFEEKQQSLSKNQTKPSLKPENEASLKKSSSLMLFLLAKEHRQFAGYELLQTVLAAGLRFGEDQLFHRHQFQNGQGPVLFSLAAATESGLFDLQNIGAFTVRGLCLFMNTSKNLGIDKERFSIMLETAKRLCEDLDAYLLDEQQVPLTTKRIESYLEELQIDETMA